MFGMKPETDDAIRNMANALSLLDACQRRFEAATRDPQICPQTIRLLAHDQRDAESLLITQARRLLDCLHCEPRRSVLELGSTPN